MFWLNSFDGMNGLVAPFSRPVEVGSSQMEERLGKK